MAQSNEFEIHAGECQICGLANPLDAQGFCAAHNRRERAMFVELMSHKAQLEQMVFKLADAIQTNVVLGSEVMDFRAGLLEARSFIQRVMDRTDGGAPNALEAYRAADKVIQKPISAFEQEAAFAGEAARISRLEAARLERLLAVVPL